jgi:hypothetical protein
VFASVPGNSRRYENPVVVEFIPEIMYCFVEVRD